MNSRDSLSILNEQEDRIRRVFTSNLSEEVKRLVEINSNFKVVDIDIATKEEEDTLLIDEVVITVKTSDDKKGEIIVDKIQILDSNQLVRENGYEDLRTLVADYLGIDKNTIFVNVI